MNVFSPSHCSLGWKKCSSYPTIKEQQSAICKCFQQQNTLFFSIPFVFGMKLLSFHPTTSSITHTRTTTHQFFSPYNTFFSVPFLVWDERNYFFIHNTPKKKITQKVINLQKQRFLHPIPILDETNSYPKKKNKNHAWFVLLPFFLSLFYILSHFSLFLGSFFSSTTSWYTFFIIQLVGWNKFVL